MSSPAVPLTASTADLLGAPLTLGFSGTTLNGRVIFGPHETNLGDGRAFSERHVAYYERRARGGAAMIVTEEASVHDSDWPYERCPLSALAAPGWKDIVDACSPHGTIVVAALGHSGGQGSSAYSQGPMWSPSRVPEVNTREVPKSIEGHEVAELISAFADSAAAAVDAGCDGVEINIGQFSILRQFLSGLTNQRGDEWADKLALPQAVIAAVRDRIGDAVVGVRLSCDELAPWAGIVPEAGADLAAELAGEPGSPLIDYITVVRGSIFSSDATRPDQHVPTGFNLDLARGVRDKVRSVHGDAVAIVAQGSIVEPDMARTAVRDGVADAAEMTRALIADAELVKKVSRGDSLSVRPCVLCNQTCQVRDARNPIVTCILDPRSGYETVDRPETGRVGSVGSVGVVGGGPAGLEAARVLAEAGVAVTLYESSETLGGAVRSAAAGSGRSTLGAGVDWLESECTRLGVAIELDAHIGFGSGARSAANGMNHDGFVIATGGLDAAPLFRTTKAAYVMSPTAALLDIDSVADPVVVWDPIGGPVGVSVAESLAEAGKTTTLVTPDNIAGNELSRAGDLAAANARLQQKGVDIIRRSLLRYVKKGTAEIENKFSGETSSIKAATVIDASHRVPNGEVFSSMESLDVRVVRAGDCVAPRTIAEAIRDGRRAALWLLGDGQLSDGVPMGNLAHG